MKVRTITELMADLDKKMPGLTDKQKEVIKSLLAEARTELVLARVESNQLSSDIEYSPVNDKSFGEKGVDGTIL